MTRGNAFLVTFFSVLYFTPLYAQSTSLEQGTPLRVSAKGLTIAGDLVRWNADSLIVYTGVEGSPAGLRADSSIATGDIVRVDALVPASRGRNAGRGALWGALIGGLIGGAAGMADPVSPGERTHGLLLGGVVLGALGAGVGTLVGLASPAERWTTVFSRPAQ